MHLGLVTTRLSTSTSTLEVSSLRTNVRLNMRVGDTSSSEMLNRLTSVLRTTKENSVSSSRRTESELIKSDNRSTGLSDTSASTISDTESTDSKGGKVVDTGIVSDGSDNNSNLVFLSLHVTSNTGNRHRGTVNLRHIKSLENSLVEGRVGTTSKEAIKLRGGRKEGERERERG